ncbi:S-adenosyl-L-methionine-dependent methyltransferase [Myxozyma melibiosi]|uniref:S-adenosyl-L-methionine-dependent methyltransferase n=1 Tax=Myxozyma melibiosi TaxID=54550 RepID=A0ABR1F6Z1_9ASCO
MTSTTGTKQTDQWSPTDYVAHASFVPALATRVVTLLDPQESDTILDLGCGDGVLSLELAARCAHVHATDSSEKMVAYAGARAAAKDDGKMRVQVIDAATEVAQLVPAGTYNKVFSSATYHWVFGSVRTTAERQRAIKDVYEILPSGGVFVVECGGQGNIAEILVALTSCVINAWARKGVVRTAEEIRQTLWPWYFVSDAEMREWLTSAGFTIDVLESEYRPTTLNGSDEGMKGWLQTFGFTFWAGLSESEKWAAIDEAVEMLRGADWVEYSKSWVAGYVRCRFRAVKK